MIFLLGASLGVLLTYWTVYPKRVAYVVHVDASGTSTLQGTTPYDCDDIDNLDNNAISFNGSLAALGNVFRESCNVLNDTCTPTMPIIAFIRSSEFPDGLCVHYIVE